MGALCRVIAHITRSPDAPKPVKLGRGSGARAMPPSTAEMVAGEAAAGSSAEKGVMNGVHKDGAGEGKKTKPKEPKSSPAASDDSQDFEFPYKLNHTWNVWYDRPGSRKIRQA